ncbi:apolipoprotein D-like [Ischnura elegans]|uniref:apolipoprotein D-like n=1 Tax=Ischnura elegans TaxID=197161 RepID=UPI001ED8A6F8|nr:apolipoprotein D-like [Ischnura elegans]XP_046382927.1 apolipoprotein D-like [Ischnura elegans]
MTWGVAVTSMAALKVLPLVVAMSYLIPATNAQVPFLLSCPPVETKADFKPDKYLGLWYEAERYPAVFEIGAKCVTATYTMNPNGTIDVLNENINSVSGIKSSIEGYATIVDPDDPAKLAVRFPSLPVAFDAPYWVVDTDYDKYAVVWSCADLTIISTRNAWILTRDRNPTVEVMEQAYAAVDKAGISRALFTLTDQKNCSETH